MRLIELVIFISFFFLCFNCFDFTNAERSMRDYAGSASGFKNIIMGILS